MNIRVNEWFVFAVLVSRAELLVVSPNQVTKFRRHGIAIDGSEWIFFVQLGNFFTDTLAQFDQRFRDALIDSSCLRSLIVAGEIDSHLAGVIGDTSRVVPEILLLQHFTDPAKSVTEVFVVLTRDSSLFPLLGLLVKKQFLTAQLSARRHLPATSVSTRAEGTASVS